MAGESSKEAVEQEAELNMTPMIDVTFQLLIFFLVTLKFKLLEKKLNSYLPTDFGTNAQPQIVDEQFITVKLKQPSKEEFPGRIIRRPTRYYIETERIEGGSTAEILAKIERKLKDFRNTFPDAKGKIETGPGVPHERVVQILDLFHAAKYKTITFTGLAQNAKINNAWFNRIKKKLADG